MTPGHDEFRERAKLLWAKSSPYKQLAAHMLDIGCCAVCLLKAESSRALLEYLMARWHCDQETAVSFAAYVAAMHDIGKAIPQFQRMDETQRERLAKHGLGELLTEVPEGTAQHEYASSRIARRIWRTRSGERKIISSYACVLSLHHQRLEKNNHSQKLSESWQVMQEELESLCRKSFYPSGILLSSDQMDAVCILLTGLVILCDWVASSGPFFPLMEVDEHYLERSMAIAKETLHSYGLTGENDTVSLNSFQELWPQIKKPRSIQQLCDSLDDDVPVTIIEAPMGEGKTEAALYLAERMRSRHDKRGIYVALPTQATSNQMYTRTKDMLNSIRGGRARLLHGTAFLYHSREIRSDGEKRDNLEAERWLGPLRMGLLDENGVGTVDQAMAGVLKARFSVLRLLGLANKVLVIDELHAYDAYMSTIIRMLLIWCRELNIPVILLSATLQDSQRRTYLSCFTDESTLAELSSGYPLVTQVSRSGVLKQFTAEASMCSVYQFVPCFLGEDVRRIAAEAVNLVVNGGCCCVIMNTVRKAQQVYEALLELSEPDLKLMLFHARFTMADRERIEKTCLADFGRDNPSGRPKKAVLVATQVVEQSLDIDFDCMISELAPIDLLLQRAGRVHRHRERVRPAGMENPIITVVLPAEDAPTDPEKRYGVSGYVYAPFLLSNTEHLLEKGLQAHVPEDVRSLIAEVYDRVSPENMEIWSERFFSQQLMQANALGAVFPEPQKDFFFPSESHPEFVPLEVDDGFEPNIRATTRLGDPTIRISFASKTAAAEAIEGEMKPELERELLLSSVALSARNISFSDLEKSDLHRIERGKLRGCYVSPGCDEIRIGQRVLVNDPILGVMWKE